MYRRPFLLLLVFGLPCLAELRLRFDAFEDAPSGWVRWSHRDEIAPRTFVDSRHDRGGGGALAIAGKGAPAVHGGWERVVANVQPGAWYRFQAFYRTEQVAAENWQVVARLDWRTASGKRAGQPDYAYQARREGDWTRLAIDAPAPANASAVALQLSLSQAPNGTVWWDDISIEQIPNPGPRRVTVASINLRPSGLSPEDNVRAFAAVIEREVRKADVILLPEGITVVGTGRSYVDVAEPIPGPSTRILSPVARNQRAWIAAGIYERDGNAVYNTAVLLDRDGQVAGKYRKVYLPREEVESGLTPGNEFPVFRTDFGTVGMMICYDVFFSDPARALALQGAELILMPIWGGDQALGKARAIEGRVYVAASGYDFPTQIMDPDGEVLALARDAGTAAITTIDLNKRFWHPHLGDMRNRRMRELRLDVPTPAPGMSR